MTDAWSSGPVELATGATVYPAAVSSAVIAVAEPPTPPALATTTVAADFETVGATVVVVDVVVLGSTSIVDGGVEGVAGMVVATSPTASSGSVDGSVIDRRITNP